MRQPIKFRKGSTAQEELEFKLCDISYGEEWHEDYFENRTYRRAVDSVIDKVRTAFPHLNEYIAEKYPTKCR